MGYRLQGLAHAHLLHLHRRLTAEAGQGTVEYVALILLVAGVFAAVVAAGTGKGDFGLRTKITDTLKNSLDAVGKK
jgi:hypothetical protein